MIILIAVVIIIIAVVYLDSCDWVLALFAGGGGGAILAVFIAAMLALFTELIIPAGAYYTDAPPIPLLSFSFSESTEPQYIIQNDDTTTYSYYDPALCQILQTVPSSDCTIAISDSTVHPYVIISTFDAPLWADLFLLPSGKPHYTFILSK